MMMIVIQMWFRFLCSSHSHASFAPACVYRVVCFTLCMQK